MDDLPELNTYGYGLPHMAVAPDPSPPCSRCGGTQRVGYAEFPLPCPDCTSVTSTGHDAAE